MRLIVGLGNPGAAYAQTRHNAGMWVVERAAARWSGRLVRRGTAQRASVRQGSQTIELAGTLDFMNVTGAPLIGLLREYQLTTDDLILVHDDLDLEPGRLRIKQAGGHGGHNGIKLLDAHCGKDYRRLRLGIGHPGVKELVQGHVLGDFAKADRTWLEPLLDALADNADMLVRNEDSQLMNKLALALGGKAEEEKPSPAARKPAAQSHIHQARNHGQPKLPATGPMADMLKKMFGNKGE